MFKNTKIALFIILITFPLIAFSQEAKVSKAKLSKKKVLVTKAEKLPLKLVNAKFSGDLKGSDILYYRYLNDGGLQVFARSNVKIHAVSVWVNAGPIRSGGFGGDTYRYSAWHYITKKPSNKFFISGELLDQKMANGIIVHVSINHRKYKGKIYYLSMK